MMDWIINLVKKPSEFLKITTDKFLHAVISFVITIVLGLLVNSAFWGMFLSVMVIGVAKELIDLKKPNPTGFDVNDLAFDCLGSYLGFLIVSLLLLIF